MRRCFSSKRGWMELMKICEELTRQDLVHILYLMLHKEDKIKLSLIRKIKKMLEVKER